MDVLRKQRRGIQLEGQEQESKDEKPSEIAVKEELPEAQNTEDNTGSEASHEENWMV